MKVYPFGSEDAPAILLLPGTCCHWKGNFGHVIPLLAANYHVLCVSYDGFDETEQSEFPTMLEETEKIETYIQENCGGHIRAAYGCSLGGSFVGLLAARQNIQIDYGILGSSDLDQASAFDLSDDTGRKNERAIPAKANGKAGTADAGIHESFSENVGRRSSLCHYAELQKSVLFGYDYAAAG